MRFLRFWFLLDADEGEAGALFTLKFDAKGTWKIVKSHQMPKKKIDAVER